MKEKVKFVVGILVAFGSHPDRNSSLLFGNPGNNTKLTNNHRVAFIILLVVRARVFVEYVSNQF